MTSNWQTSATAPRNGTRFIAWINEAPVIAHWCGTCEKFEGPAHTYITTDFLWVGLPS